MLKIVNLSGIILVLAWISFIPQPIQNRYQAFVRIFLIALLVISIIRRRFRLKLIFSKEDIWLWLFLIGITGGVFFAENFEMAARQYFCLFFPMFSLYYLLKNEFSQKNWLPIIRSICLFGAVVALLGILECLFYKNPIYEYFIYNPFYKRYISHYPHPRAMSSQLNPVPLGSYLLASLPFSFLLIKKKGILNQSLGISCVVLNTICIIWTFSRGVFLGASAMFLFYFWKKRQFLFLKFFIAILISIILICSFLRDPLFARFGASDLIYGRGSHSIFSEYRFLRVLTSFKMLKDHPFVGIGLNNYRINFDRYYPSQEHDDEWKIADNMYLTILAETGAIGFLGFFAFIWFILRRSFCYLHMIKESENKEVLIVVLAGLIGLLVNMGAYELFYWTTPFFLFCILIGLVIALTKNCNYVY